MNERKILLGMSNLIPIIYDMDDNFDNPSFKPVLQVILIEKIKPCLCKGRSENIGLYRVALSDGNHSLISTFSSTSNINSLIEKGEVKKNCLLQLNQFFTHPSKCKHHNSLVIMNAEKVVDQVEQIGNPVDIWDTITCKSKEDAAPLKPTQKDEYPTVYELALNRLLDSYIESEEVIDNEVRKWGDITIESFVAHLSTKFDIHERDKKKDKRTPSHGNMKLLSRSGIDYKDLLPTISIEEAAANIDSAECGRCKRLMCLRDKTMGNMGPNRLILSNGKLTVRSIDVHQDIGDGVGEYELRQVTKRYLQIEAPSRDLEGSSHEYPITTQSIVALALIWITLKTRFWIKSQKRQVQSCV